MKEIEKLEYISKLVNYDPVSGLITWHIRDVKSAADNVFNSLFAGKVAGTIHHSGYIFINFNYMNKARYISAHRLAWYITNNDLFNLEVDHINHNRSDNRICNLRAVSRAENNKNVSIRNDNNTGSTGVGFVKKTKKYRSRIRVDGKLINLGTFDLIADAISARKQAEKKYNFHENHGALK